MIHWHKTLCLEKPSALWPFASRATNWSTASVCLGWTRRIESRKAHNALPTWTRHPCGYTGKYIGNYTVVTVSSYDSGTGLVAARPTVKRSRFILNHSEQRVPGPIRRRPGRSDGCQGRGRQHLEFTKVFSSVARNCLNFCTDLVSFRGKRSSSHNFTPFFQVYGRLNYFSKNLSVPRIIMIHHDHLHPGPGSTESVDFPNPKGPSWHKDKRKAAFETQFYLVNLK